MTTEPPAADPAADPPYPRRYSTGSAWIVLPEPVEVGAPVVRLGGAELDEQDLQACSVIEVWNGKAWQPVS